MNRRQFLQLSGVLAAGAATGSCARLTPRYTPPPGITRPEEKLLLKNASLVDVRRGTVEPGRLVLIQEGRIVETFSPESAQGVAADRQVDLGHAFLCPGIINAHCHMTIPGGISFGPGFFFAFKRQLERNAEECVKHGVTTVRDMLAVSDFLVELQEKICRGEIVGPRIRSCCAMDVNGGYGDQMSFLAKKRFWRQVDSPEEGREAVRAAVDSGADFIKLFQQPRELFLPGKPLPVMETELIRAIREEAERRGLYVAVHHTEKVGLLRCLDSGVRSLEHMTTDTVLTDEEIRRIADGGPFLVPTASVAFALAYERRGDPNWGKGFSPRIAEERVREMPRLIEEFCEPELAPGSLRFFRELSDPASFEARHLLPWPDPSVMNAAANNGSINTRLLQEAGATFGCGNDGGVPLIFPGAMGVEMVLLQEQGIGPAEILRMATLNNARLLHLEQELGTVEKGKIADLVVFAENPLEDLYTTLTPRQVFQAGRLVFGA